MNIAPTSTNSSTAIVVLLFFMGILLPTPIFYHLSMEPRILGATASLIGVYLWFRHARTLKPGLILAMLALLLLSSISGFYWSDPIIVLIPGYFLASCFLVAICTKPEIERFVELASNFLIAINVLAWISLFYYLGGGEPWLNFMSPDGREISLHLATLALAGSGLVFRSAGIYDEPGALAFFIAAVAASRHLLGLPKSRTWVLLLTGFVTLSLAHLIYTLVHLACERLSLKNITSSKGMAALVSFATLVIVVAYQLGDIFYDELLLRLAWTDGKFGGDNRSIYWEDAFSYFNTRVLLFGVDKSCVINHADCWANYQIGSDLFTPLLMRGLLVSFAYYAVVLSLLILAFFSRRNHILIGVVLVFLQRPYVMSFGYAVWAAVIFVLALHGARYFRLAQHKPSLVHAQP